MPQNFIACEAPARSDPVSLELPPGEPALGNRRVELHAARERSRAKRAARLAHRAVRRRLSPTAPLLADSPPWTHPQPPPRPVRRAAEVQPLPGNCDVGDDVAAGVAPHGQARRVASAGGLVAAGGALAFHLLWSRRSLRWALTQRASQSPMSSAAEPPAIGRIALSTDESTAASRAAGNGPESNARAGLSRHEADTCELP